ncbi:MAG: hypothetical protein SNJ54_15460 [Anaerolineae bacterium]
MKAVQHLVVVPLSLLVLAVLACGTVVTEQASYTCPTPVPQPTPTVLLLPGTPLPPLIIPPAAASPTPYTIAPPWDFYLGDAVFVGQRGAPLRLRFRLQDVQVRSAGARNLVTWQLEIRNLGSTPYETIPVALMLITRITTANGRQTGTWRTSEAAMRAAGFTDENYDRLLPGLTRLYRLAAYIPAGRPDQFTYLLDGDGSNRITWTNQGNPYCSGDVAD